MAGSRIKGITVEIGGDVTGLEKALKSVNTTIKQTQSQLKDVERLLKIDPSNTELLAQKQEKLKDAVTATKEKLDALKTAQEQAKQKMESGDLGKDKYDALQREIIETEQELERLAKQAAESNTALTKIGEAGKALENVGNKGIAPQYYVEDDHGAIIPRHVYRMVQEEMVRRANLKTGTGRKSVYSGKYALSSMVYCAHCGDLFQRTLWVLKGEHVQVWRCVSRLKKRKNDIDCKSRTIFEKDLHAAVVAAVNQLIGEKDEMLEELKKNVAKVVGSSNRAAIAEIDNQLDRLQTEVLKKANARQDFDKIGDEIERLRDQKQKLLLEDAQNIALQQQVEYLGSFLDKQEGGITEYDEALVRKLIEKITVYDDRLVFEFKSGLEIEVKM